MRTTDMSTWHRPTLVMRPLPCIVYMLSCLRHQSGMVVLFFTSKALSRYWSWPSCSNNAVMALCDLHIDFNAFKPIIVNYWLNWGTLKAVWKLLLASYLCRDHEEPRYNSWYNFRVTTICKYSVVPQPIPPFGQVMKRIIRRPEASTWNLFPIAFSFYFRF